MCHPLPYKRITINTWSICKLGILELCSVCSVSQNSSYNIDTKYIHPLTVLENPHFYKMIFHRVLPCSLQCLVRSGGDQEWTGSVVHTEEMAVKIS